MTPVLDASVFLAAISHAERPRFYACVFDEALLQEAVRVARIARLRAYDAVYVALALTRAEPLLTLDGEVVSRSTTCFPELRLAGG